MTSLFERLQQQLDTTKNTWAGKDYLQVEPKWINPDINILKSLIDFQEGWIPDDILPFYNQLLSKYSDFLTLSTEAIRAPFVALNTFQFIRGVQLAFNSKQYPEQFGLLGRVTHYGQNSQVTKASLDYYISAHDAMFDRFKIQNVANKNSFKLVPAILGSTDMNGKQVYNVLPLKETPNIGNIYTFFSNISKLCLELVKPNLVKPEIQNEFLVASAGPIFMPTTLQPAPIAYVLGDVISGVLMKSLGINGEICARYAAGHLFRQLPSLVSSPIVLAGKTILNSGVWMSLIPYAGVIIAVVILIIIIIKLMEDEDLTFLGDIWLFDDDKYLETVFAQISGKSNEIKESLTEYLREYSHLNNPKIFVLDDENMPIIGLNNAGEIPKELIAPEFKKMADAHDLHFEDNLWGRGRRGTEDSWL